MTLIWGPDGRFSGVFARPGFGYKSIKRNLDGAGTVWISGPDISNSFAWIGRDSL